MEIKSKRKQKNCPSGSVNSGGIILISEKQVLYPWNSVMHLHSGLTFNDIARESSVSINTIQSRYRYGLEKLRSILNGGMQR